MDYWLEIYAKPNVTSSTYRGYESVIRNHVISEMGDSNALYYKTPIPKIAFRYWCRIIRYFEIFLHSGRYICIQAKILAFVFKIV